VKWDRKYQEKYGIDWRSASDLPPAVEATLDRLSRRIYRALGLSGYARMDFRVRDNGEVFVLEANANPNIGEAEDFAQSALTAGIGYQDLLNRLITLGIAYKAEWRAGYG
jgi:D-alanine-D-alanine ligase